MPDQPFIDAAGLPLPRMQGEGYAVPPDAFNAIRLLIAMVDGDVVEADQILTGFPAVPLLTGVAGIALTLGEIAAGGDQDKLRRMLDLVALNPIADPAGTADAYRDRRTA